MEKEYIVDQVKKCGNMAQESAEAARKLDDAGVDATKYLILSVGWMQAKMLGEIAYQLAVMNERASEIRG